MDFMTVANRQLIEDGPYNRRHINNVILWGGLIILVATLSLRLLDALGCLFVCLVLVTVLLRTIAFLWSSRVNSWRAFFTEVGLAAAQVPVLAAKFGQIQPEHIYRRSNNGVGIPGICRVAIHLTKFAQKEREVPALQAH